MKIANILHRKQNICEANRQRETLVKNYAQLIGRLREIRSNYDFVSEKAAIDALIYEENAVLSKLEALFSDAKERGINLEYYEFAKEAKK